MKTLTIRNSFTVPAAQKAQLKTIAADQGISLSELIRQAIDRYMALDDANALRTDK